MKYFLPIVLALALAGCIRPADQPAPAARAGKFGFPCLCDDGSGVIDTVTCHFAYYGVPKPGKGDNCRACCANLTGENPNL